MCRTSPRGPLQAAAAEDAEELLGAMPTKSQSHHRAKYEAREIHVDSPWVEV